LTVASQESTPVGHEAPGYLRSHWRGRQSLAWSFWVNLVLLTAILLSVENLIIKAVFGDPSAAAAAVLVSFVAFRLIICIWQIVGLARACDRYQRAYGSIATVWAVHLGIVASLAFVCTSVLASAQSVFLERETELLSSRWERERAAKYALTLSDDGTVIFLNGSFEGGITKGLAALMEEHRALRTVVLESPGGNTFEGRGVARLIRAHRLDTHVAGDCFSACTLAFIAGEARTLGPRGRLGFHQYGLDAQYQLPFVDIADEQDSDRETFEARSVGKEFVEKIFDAPHEGLWIPSSGELVDAGVIHAIAETTAGD
jgi:hypothetical protein